jgi:hypothetical protein
MLNRYAREQNKERFGEKTPYNLFFIEAILNDFPNAQFIFITRDGRDASADYLESAFGPTNIFCAAEIWKMGQNAVKPWRKKLPTDQWLDVKYEDLVRSPENILRGICEFLNEEYSPTMLDFFTSDLAKKRGATRDHKPLGSPVSDEFIGIYKDLLSPRDQRIFTGVAGKELEEAGYQIDVEPVELDEGTVALYRETDSRIRAAVLDGPDGHIVYESYNDWLVDQREARREAGIWDSEPTPPPFPRGNPHEELIMGQRAWRCWKNYFCIKRQYDGKAAL